SNGSFSYVQSANYNGSDSSTDHASDRQAAAGMTTAIITITGVNDAPVALNDSYTTAEDTTLNVAVPGVLANDTDVDGDTLSAVRSEERRVGNEWWTRSGRLSYGPTAN